MNLPHLPPVLFAQKVVKKEEDILYVKCLFPCFPTLPMILEAAAQASSGFCEELKKGFLAAANSVVLKKEVDKKEVVIKVEKEVSLESMTLFNFSAEGFAEGRFTVYAK